jgi:hypothetical protein
VRITPRQYVLDQLEARRDAIVIKCGTRPVNFRVGFRLASNLTIQQIGLRINKNTLAQGVLKDESMYRWAKRPPKTPPVRTTTSSGHNQFMGTWSAQLAFLPACFLHPFTQDSRWHPKRSISQFVDAVVENSGFLIGSVTIKKTTIVVLAAIR